MVAKVQGKSRTSNFQVSFKVSDAPVKIFYLGNYENMSGKIPIISTLHLYHTRQIINNQ